MHDSAVPIVSPSGAREREHDLLHGSLVLGERVPVVLGTKSGRELVRSRLGARLDEHVDVDLEVARTNRDVDALPVAARLVQRPCDGRLADAVEAKRAPAAGTST